MHVSDRASVRRRPKAGRTPAVSDDAYQALCAQLGATAPAGLRELGDDELRDLACAVRDARRRQAKALGEAGDRALNHIPRLLRGPVRRIVT
jgi:hypothetical protein